MERNLEDILDELIDRVKDYELEDVEIVEEDAKRVYELVGQGMDYESACDKVLSDIREVLDEGLSDEEDCDED